MDTIWPRPSFPPKLRSKYPTLWGFQRGKEDDNPQLGSSLKDDNCPPMLTEWQPLTEFLPLSVSGVDLDWKTSQHWALQLDLINGALIGAQSDQKGSRTVFPVGKLEGLRFMCGFRFKMWWMTQRMGQEDSQFGEDEGNQSAIYVFFLPILESDFRAVLQGNANNELEICLESGDPAVQQFEGSHLVFVAATIGRKPKFAGFIITTKYF
ncbi:hypothetical protein M9H77_16476 [Catharanthus roseus]|uniref:Uncharacterized protein n=1 Tax=Catharanthus roseus TaxID=4058 RepID=A0ACC0B285_CATRO|nr:hypothetical protein M9H77_16476 [Catharanthus roseus]